MADDVIPERYRRWLLHEWDQVLDGWEQSLRHGRGSDMERSWYWRVDQHVRVMWHLDVMEWEIAQGMMQARDPEFTGDVAMEDLENAGDDEHED